MNEVFATLGQSDVAGASVPDWYAYAATQGAHWALGALVALRIWPGWVPCAALAALMSKELFADLPHGAFAPLVLADSAADVACVLAGFWMVRRW